VNVQDLLDLRGGRIAFVAFARQHDNYLTRLANYFFRRVLSIQCPVDVEDLKQIGLAELWEAVGEYEFRCPECSGRFTTHVAFAMHVSIDHPESEGQPRPTILQYVHGRVGRSMDHELRRHQRRSKYHDKVRRRSPDSEEGDFEAQYSSELSEGATQDSLAELSMLVERARKELDPVRLNVLMGMAYDIPRSAHGVSPRRVGKIRAELREGWMKQLG